MSIQLNAQIASERNALDYFQRALNSALEKFKLRNTSNSESLSDGVRACMEAVKFEMDLLLKLENEKRQMSVAEDSIEAFSAYLAEAQPYDCQAAVEAASSAFASCNDLSESDRIESAREIDIELTRERLELEAERDYDQYVECLRLLIETEQLKRWDIDRIADLERREYECEIERHERSFEFDRLLEQERIAARFDTWSREQAEIERLARVNGISFEEQLCLTF
jgi:hypothetical protein